MRYTFALWTLICALLMINACGQTPASTHAAPAELPTGSRTQAELPTSSPAPTPSEPAPAPQMLAYIQAGDLWVRQIPGSAARQISSTGNASSPRWSPSGSWLLYCAGDQLRVLRAAGTDQYTLGLCPGAWSPTSDTLVYSTDTGTAIVTPGLWKTQPLSDTALLWNPSGTALASVRDQSLDGAGATLSQYSESLWLSPAGSGAPTSIYTPTLPSGDGMILAGWAGGQILYWDNPQLSASLLADGTSLWAMPERGGAPRQIVPAMLAYPEFLSVSPDQRTLALVAGDNRDTSTNKQIVLHDLGASTTVTLTDQGTAAVAPAWSPDSQRIAYAAAVAQSGDSEELDTVIVQRHIWVAARDGMGQQQLTSDPFYRDERPRWSSDGQQLFFGRLDTRNQASIWSISSGGGAPTELVADIGPFPDDSMPPGYYGRIDWDSVFDLWPGAR